MTAFPITVTETLYEQRRRTVLTFMKSVPMVSTEQVARFFHANGSPMKRASDFLRRLESEKVIEGRDRERNKSRVYRLSKSGRDSLGVIRAPQRFQTNKIEHTLAIGDFYLDLMATGALMRFESELREEYEHHGKQRKFSPDAFFVWGGRAYLLEMQLTPLSSGRWAQKWRMYDEFFGGRHHEQASFQIVAGKVLRPRIVVVSGQRDETVLTGADSHTVVVVKDAGGLISEGRGMAI